MRYRASALLLAIPLAAAAPVHAQNVALFERFDFSTTGVFPPAGWVETDLTGSGHIGWAEFGTATCGTFGVNDVAGHDGDWVNFQVTRLESPAIDLTSYSAPRLQFHAAGCDTFALLSSNQGGADLHEVEVSTDGGLTWTVEWSADTGGASSYEARPIAVDLSNYAGLSQAQVGFKYSGSTTQWTIDNVIVIDAPTDGTLMVVGVCGQTNSYLFVQDVTPLANIAFLYSVSLGSRVYSSPGCAAVASSLDVFPARVVGVTQASGFGTATLTRLHGIPAGACGTYIQAVDMATCLPTNVVQL